MSTHTVLNVVSFHFIYSKCLNEYKRNESFLLLLESAIKLEGKITNSH